MKYFEEYVSNSIAGSGNHLFFTMVDGEKRTGRIFYKIAEGGEYNYSILYSNIMDSTFSIGDVSNVNMICDSWTIHSARVGICKDMHKEKDAQMLVMDEDIIVSNFRDLTFNSMTTKEVMPGEFFATDSIKLNFEKGDFMCIEMTYSGKMIPYMEDSILATYNKTESGWEFDKKMPFVGMIGCDRKVKKRIGYIGDSITQGVETRYNAYEHWNALLSERLGGDFACWNLGIGFARANDAATNGAWMFKAKNNDIMFVCLGTNDIGRGFEKEQIAKDLTTTVDLLKKAGMKVVLQTVPPYVGWTGNQVEKWLFLNDYIKNTLAEKVDMVFDVSPSLCVSEDMPWESAYGGHPNAEGCQKWANALYEAVRDFIQDEAE